MNKEFVIGALKSKLMWLGTVIAASPAWWPLVADKVTELLGGPNKLTVLAGILVVVFRAMTTQSLEHKGGMKNERSDDVARKDISVQQHMD